MSVVKVIEVISEGNSIEEAMKAAVAEAAKTVKFIKQINVQRVEALVENEKLTKFRVNSKISFLVKNEEHK
jgi:flavin-binding protein dodecin